MLQIALPADTRSNQRWRIKWKVHHLCSVNLADPMLRSRTKTKSKITFLCGQDGKKKNLKGVLILLHPTEKKVLTYHIIIFLQYLVIEDNSKACIEWRQLSNATLTIHFIISLSYLTESIFFGRWSPPLIPPQGLSVTKGSEGGSEFRIYQLVSL